MAGSSLLRCEVLGLDEMKSVLAQLGAQMEKQIVRTALAASLKPVATEAARLAPSGTDSAGALVARLVRRNLARAPKALRARAAKELALRDSIIITTVLSASQERRRVRPPSQYEAFVSSTAPHAHLVEYGHRLVKARHEGARAMRGRKGQRRMQAVKTKRVIGHVAARPFLRPAFDSRKDLVLTTFAAEVRKGIERTIARLGRQAAAGTLSRAGRVALRIGR